MSQPAWWTIVFHVCAYPAISVGSKKKRGCAYLEQHMGKYNAFFEKWAAVLNLPFEEGHPSGTFYGIDKFLSDQHTQNLKLLPTFWESSRAETSSTVSHLGYSSTCTAKTQLCAATSSWLVPVNSSVSSNQSQSSSPPQ